MKIAFILFVVASLCTVDCKQHKKTRLAGTLLTHTSKVKEKNQLLQDLQAFTRITEQPPEEFTRMKDFSRVFLKVAKKIGLHIVGKIADLVTKHPKIGIATGILLAAYSGVEDDERPVTVWDKIKDNVNAKIEQYVTRGHFDQFHGKFDAVRLRKLEKFEETDLLYWTTLKHEVFPQDELDANYNPAWVPNIILWIMHVMAGYATIRTYHPPSKCDTTKEYNCLSKCAISEELVIIRHEIIQAIQDLYKKRYRDIRGTKWAFKNVLFTTDNYKLSLQYEDTATGKLHPETMTEEDFNVLNLKSSVLDPLIKEVHDVAEKLVDNFNDYVDIVIDSKISDGVVDGVRNIIMSDGVNSCKLPKKIPKFFSKKYNVRYFGSTGDEAPCMFPCAKYGFDEARCPNDEILKKGSSVFGLVKNTFSMEKIIENVNWRNCTLPDLDTLIPSLKYTVDDWLTNRRIAANVDQDDKNLIFKKPQGLNNDNPTTELSFDSDIKSTTSWGEWERCESNSFIFAFSSKESYGSPLDDLGVTGLKLHCSDGNHITSLYDTKYGVWTKWKKCPWGYNGAVVRSGNSYGIGDVSLRCVRDEHNKVNELQSTINHNKEKKIKYLIRKEEYFCPEGLIICALKTEVDELTMGNDFGMTKLKLECCIPTDDYYQL